MKKGITIVEISIIMVVIALLCSIASSAYEHAANRLQRITNELQMGVVVSMDDVKWYNDNFSKYGSYKLELEEARKKANSINTVERN
jgi:Tfp pilus assembly protein PilE